MIMPLVLTWTSASMSSMLLYKQDIEQKLSELYNYKEGIVGCSIFYGQIQNVLDVHPCNSSHKTFSFEKPIVKEGSQAKAYQMGLQEFDLEMKGKKGYENVVVDQLSILVNKKNEANLLRIQESFPDEQFFQASDLL